VAIAGAAAAYIASSAPDAAVVLTITAVGGVVLLAAGIAIGMLDMVLWAVGALAAAYVALLVYRAAAPDAWSALIAVGLLLSSEMASWSIDCRGRGRDDAAVHALRLRAIAIALGVALVLVVVVQAAGDVGGGGIASEALATVAVLLGVGAVCLLMWRNSPSEAP
jgi:hypothetical protein